MLSEYAQQAKGGTVICKLLLKKRYFLPSDAAVEGERQFIRLCYKQVSRDTRRNRPSVCLDRRLEPV